ncbi:MAG TPA: allantoinase AllB [Candidatus Limnocylindria bacterium]|jgi:dihydroorotase|nr:allantoinase AllB [Candidatus Limnocylindria bacterium]
MTAPDRYDLLVRGGTLVTDAGRRRADVGVAGGTIAAIGQFDGEAPDVVDAQGLLVLPGLIDGHVHFRQPGLEAKEDWLTGSRAAVMGGVTTVLDMPNTLPPTVAAAAARAKAELASATAYCDFGLIGLLGAENLDALPELIGSGLVRGLKVFLGPTTGRLSAPADADLRRGLSVASEAGLRVCFHAEERGLIERAEADLRAAGRSDARAHLDSRPVAAEVAAIERVGRLLAETGAAGHVLHLSSADGLARVERWRAQGVDLTCEVTPHHLLLGLDEYARLGGLVKCNPPVRGEPHSGALLEALADGRIDVVASDHAPHRPDEKSSDDIWRVAAGVAGVETTLRLMLTEVAGGRLTLERLVAAMSATPARLWRLAGKGRLEPGADADLTLIDAQRTGVIRGAELHGRHGLTPFEGRRTVGMPVATIVRGRLMMRERRLAGASGWGRIVG